MGTKHDTQLRWYNVAFLGMAVVWGIGNVFTNYHQQGLSVIFSWIVMMTIYFLPYALIVGQLGSTFKDETGGVTSWIQHSSTKTLAYFASWIYWVVHVPYLAQKPQGILNAISWLIFGDGRMIQSDRTWLIQLMCLATWLFFLWVSSRGLRALKLIGGAAGLVTIIMSFVLIFLALAGPKVVGLEIQTADMTKLSTYIPKFNFHYLTTISMMVFAVGGCEKISTYVNKTKNASREFPLGMLVLAIIVIICAILGSLAAGFLFDSNNIPADLAANGAYASFKILGEAYGLGSLLTILYALVGALGQISATVISIDAPLTMLFRNANPEFVPKSLSKENKNGVLINAYKLVGILVGIMILIPALGIGEMTGLFNWLLKLNSIVMPMRYMFVFAAFIFINKEKATFDSEYKFTKNKTVGRFVGWWCLLFTAFACILGMIPKPGSYKDSKEFVFMISLNIIIPFVLAGLGLILPAIAKRELAKEL